MSTTKRKNVKVRSEPTPPDGVPRLLTKAHLTVLLGVSMRKLESMLTLGQFPKCDFPIGDMPRWRAQTYLDWCEAEAAKNKKEKTGG